ncbi:MAG: hypothetical protein ACTSPY_00605 [Candidatus Helarchaeota archaeon]
MKEIPIPSALLDYYKNLDRKKVFDDFPTCPVCKNKMIYLKHVFMEYRDEIGTIRKFRCNHCLKKEVILWRK